MNEPSHVPSRLRWAYELGRARRALIEALPALGFLAVVLLEGPTPVALGAALLLYATAVLAHVIGQSAAMAVLPSLAFGLVPLTIVRVAESAGHVCLGDRCVAWCLPACVLGGLVGGALVGLRGNRAPDRAAFTLTAATLVILAGGLGCACSGSAGLAGIALGVGVGAAVPSLWRAATA